MVLTSWFLQIWQFYALVIQFFFMDLVFIIISFENGTCHHLKHGMSCAISLITLSVNDTYNHFKNISWRSKPTKSFEMIKTKNFYKPVIYITRCNVSVTLTSLYIYVCAEFRSWVLNNLLEYVHFTLMKMMTKNKVYQQM